MHVCSEIKIEKPSENPDDLNRLASSLLERLTNDQKDVCSNPLRERTW
jgi:hypothetical protein